MLYYNYNFLVVAHGSLHFSIVLSSLVAYHASHYPLHLPYDYLRKNKNQVFSDDHYLESEVV